MDNRWDRRRPARPSRGSGRRGARRPTGGFDLESLPRLIADAFRLGIPARPKQGPRPRRVAGSQGPVRWSLPRFPDGFFTWFKPTAVRPGLPSRPGPGPRPPRPRPWDLRAAAIVALGVIGVIVIVATVVTADTLASLPDPARLKRLKGDGAVILRFSDGSPMAQVGIRPGPTVALARVPAAVREGFLATEDRRFYQHPGVDVVGVARALWVDLENGGRGLQGGSTITEQLAKMYFFKGITDRTIGQKIREALLSLKIEKSFSKEEIFEYYMTVIPYGVGHDVFGVADAAQYYYGIDISQVNLAQAATIVGAANAVSANNPRVYDHSKTDHNENAWRRAQTVLSRMLAAGYIDQATLDATIRAGPPPTVPDQAPELWRYAQDLIIGDYNLKFAATDRKTKLIVTTTIDRRAQAAAEAAVQSAVGSGGPIQAVLLALDGQGRVRAFVNATRYFGAARGYADSRYQVGSLMKAFIYAAAIEAGGRPDDLCDDVGGAFGAPPWRPRNDDGNEMGPISLETAFAYSSNIDAVRVANETGYDRVVGLLRRVGMPPPPPPSGAAWPLSAAASPMQVARGLIPFANGGHAQPLRFIDSIVDGDAQDIGAAAAPGPPVLSPDVLAAEHRLMRAVVTRKGATGVRAGVEGLWIFGKTGTTSQNKDAWFGGYGRDFVVVVWVGRPTDQKSMPGVFGGTIPATIFHNFMANQTLGWGGSPPAEWAEPASAPPVGSPPVQATGGYYQGPAHPPPGQGCHAGG